MKHADILIWYARKELSVQVNTWISLSGMQEINDLPSCVKSSARLFAVTVSCIDVSTPQQMPSATKDLDHLQQWKEDRQMKGVLYFKEWL